MDRLAEELYRKSGAERYGLSGAEFGKILAGIAGRYLPARSTESEIAEFCKALHLEDLALARACAAGKARAWEDFIRRFQEKLRAAARGIAGDESRGRELADSIYARLYGAEERDGRRKSRLEHYCGRGSLEGWLRAVLAREYVNEWRGGRRMVSLEEQGAGESSGGSAEADASGEVDPRVNLATDEALAAISAEDRCLLACYYLDGDTLAQIACVLGVHEATVSRRLGRLARSLREEIVAGLMHRGMDARQAAEALEVDVRDLTVDIRRRLTQDSGAKTFPEARDLPADKVETER